MTREEAIRCLGVHSSTNGSGLCTDEQHYKAKQMAIQALSQEPTIYPPCEDCRKKMDEIRRAYDRLSEQEPCADAIDREELLKAISTWDRFGVDDTNSLFRLDNLSLPYYVPYIHYDDVIECIKGMPSVTQKSGKWIKKGNTLKCPFCGAKGEDIKDDYCFNYCPNCGAKMESEDKE